MKKNKDTLVKTITITCEESLVDNKIVQNVSFDLKNMSKFEALGFLRLYEQAMSISLLRGNGEILTD